VACERDGVVHNVALEPQAVLEMLALAERLGWLQRPG